MRVSQRGTACQGRGVPDRQPGGARGRRWDGGETLQGRETHAPLPQTGLLWGAPGRRTAG
jgi:hypothetical protein